MKIYNVCNENVLEDKYYLSHGYVCNENLVEDKCHLSHAQHIREKYDDLSIGHKNLSVILNCPPKSVSIIFT